MLFIVFADGIIEILDFNKLPDQCYKDKSDDLISDWIEFKGVVKM